MDVESQPTEGPGCVAHGTTVAVETVARPGAAWGAFVAQHPDATLAHAAAWPRVLAAAYGLESICLQAKDAGGAVVGVLPVARFRTLRGGRELISLPFLDTGGVLAASAEVERALIDAALAAARAHGAAALELRQASPLPGRAPATPLDRVGMVLPLEADEDAQWKAFRSEVRNQTRKAEKSGLRPVVGGIELLDDFYGPFAENMRDLGSPAHPRRFFAALAEAFGDAFRIVATRDGDRAVGGLVALEHAGVVHVPWASTLRSERRRCPNNQIYWEALRFAVARGARAFDFGRSPRGEGTWRFKKGWGAQERELGWLRLTADGRPLPYRAAGDSALLVRLSAWWTRLPRPVADFLGPRLRRRIAS